MSDIPGSQLVDDYIAGFTPEVQSRMLRLRAVIHEEVPDLSEKIAYGMPTFVYRKKNFVHFAGFAKHIGFYPTPNGITAFQKEISGLKWAKGSVQFPLSQDLPWDLIRAMLRFRLAEFQG